MKNGLRLSVLERGDPTRQRPMGMDGGMDRAAMGDQLGLLGLGAAWEGKKGHARGRGCSLRPYP